ncbi:hypothetical protein JB92DRAFT_3106767 [Gautieria morchelliformis]|nr:hypothetical protein JB92DRAFT_3106767 [Gautieria morchelliformis]
MSATAEFLSKAATAFQHTQGDALSQLVLQDLNDPDVELISEELLPEDVNIRIIVLKSLSNDNQTRLADLMGTVLQYVRDATLLDQVAHLQPTTEHRMLYTLSLPNLLLQNSFELRDTLASSEPILGFLGPQMDNLHFFTKAEQVTFHYYAGSVLLVKEELRPARDHLQLAFELCTNHSLKNKRLIVINLVTVSNLLGIFPHPHLLAMFGLSDYFLSLIRAIKLGDRSAFRHYLDSNIEWFRERYIYLILRAKGEVLVIRSLFRRAIVLSRNLWPPEKIGQPPKIQFEQLLIAIRLTYRYSAIGDMDVSTWDQVDMEGLCASLVDQASVNGPTLGFPPVSSIAVRNEE